MSGAVGSLTSVACWIGFAFTLTAAAVFFVLSYVRNVKAEARMMYYAVTLINAITAIAYLIMAMGGVWQQGRGFSATVPNYVQWLRYASYGFVIPLTIYLFGHLSGSHWVDIVWVTIASIASIASLYAAAISTGFNAVWAVFALGLFFGFPLAIALVYTFRANAYRTHREIGRLYDVLGFGFLIMCVGYAVVWGVAEGGLMMTFDQSMITYTLFDIITKVVFGAVLIYGRESIARYGSFIGVNTGVDFDFPIAKSTYTSSSVGYAEEPKTQVVMGEHRDLGFAQLHAATNTTAPAANVNWWPEPNVPGSERKQL
jgi:bacteriorhodopsin